MGVTVQDIARRHHGELGLTVSEDIWPEERFFFRSDHFSFARREIPALFFFAGTHEDYHRPGDEIQDIDADKAARVGRLVFLLTHAIADDDAPPQWDPAGLSAVRELTASQ
jgi:Zn-dependent M28 family amino/carboxypeptidase